MAAAFQRTLTALRREGASVRPIDIAGMLNALVGSRERDVLRGCPFHEQRYQEYGLALEDMATSFGRGSNPCRALRRGEATRR